MSRRNRWVVVLLALAIGVVVADRLVRTLGLAATRERVIHSLAEATGLDIRVHDDFQLQLLPVVELEASGITATVPGSKSERPLLRVDALSLELSLWALLERRIEIDSIHLRGTEVDIVQGATAPTGKALEAEDLEALATDAAPGQPFDIELREIRFEDLRVTLRDASEGEIAGIVVDDGSVVAASLESPLKFEMAGSLAGAKILVDGTLGSLDEIFRPSGSYPVDVDVLSPDTEAVDDQELQFSVEGTLGRLDSLEGLALDIHLEAENPQLPQALANRGIPAIDEAKANLRVFESEGRIALEGDVGLVALGGGLRLDLAGSHPDLNVVEGTALDVAAQARDLALIGELLSLASPLPSLQPVTVKGHLSDRLDRLAISDLAIAIGDPGETGAELTGTATVNARFEERPRDVEAWLALVEQADLRLRARVPDLPYVATLAALDQSLPKVGPIAIAGQVVGNENRYAIEDISARIGGSDLSADATGRLDLARVDSIPATTRGSALAPWLAWIRNVDLALTVQAEQLAAAGKKLELPWKLPSLGPVSAKAKLRGKAQVLSLDDLDARVGTRSGSWVEGRGSIGNVEGLLGVHIDAEFHAADLALVKPYLDFEPPEIGPVHGSFALSDRDGSLGVEGLRISGGRKTTLELEVSGEFDDLRETDEISFEARLGAANLHVAGRLFGVDLPAVADVAFNGRVKGSDENIDSHGTLRLDDTVIDGDWSGSFVPNQRPTFQAQIHSPWIQLDDLGIEPTDDEMEDEGEGLWNRTEPLPFAELRGIDATIELRVDRVTGIGDLDLGRAHSRLRLKDGDLLFEQQAEGKNTGEITGELHLNAAADVPTVELHANLDSVDLQRLVAQLSNDGSSGLLDARVALTTRGGSPVELRRNLAGALGLVVRDGTFAGAYGGKFVRNFIRVSVPSLGAPKKPRFGCIVAAFDFQDGLGTARSLFLESENVEVTGTGTVDVGKDAIDLVLEPVSRKPGVLSVTATVLVQGPLTDPVIKPKLRTVAKNIGRGVAKNLLRPANALLAPFRKKSEITVLCEEGLD